MLAPQQRVLVRLSHVCECGHAHELRVLTLSGAYIWCRCRRMHTFLVGARPDTITMERIGPLASPVTPQQTALVVAMIRRLNEHCLAGRQ